MTGVLGEFFGIIPKVVVAVLAGSLVEALFILPSHMAELGGRRQNARLNAFGARVSERFERVLSWCLTHKKTTIAGAYLVFGALLAVASTAKDVVLISEGDVDAFDVRVRMPADSSVHATDRALAEVERRLVALRTDDVEALWTTRGLSRDSLRAIEEDYVGLATVALVPVEARSESRAGRALMAEAMRAFDDLVGPQQVSVVEHELGPPVGSPITVRLAGDDNERLGALGNEVVRELRRVAGVTSVENTEVGEKRELRVVVDEGRAALHGLTADAVGRWLRLAFSGAPVATTLVDNERVEVVVGLDAAANTPDEMRALTLLSPQGDEVALGAIADIVEERRPNHIRRNDGRRGVRITAEIDGSTTSQEANRRVAQIIAPLRDANPDIAFVLAGEYEETNESLRSLVFAFIVAVLLIYSVLAAQFRSLVQPFVVLAAIPLSLIGVILGFFASGTPIGLIALVGAVGLAGIVVNDSLVLVDFVNRLRREGRSLEDAIREGTRLRLRPIVATSVTTIAGVLPLALSGDGAPLLSPMAVAIAWGLTSATILTLLVVPCLYYATETASAAMARRFGPLLRRVTGADDEALPG
jgi:multidrug efflux pump subunit AcrB